MITAQLMPKRRPDAADPGSRADPPTSHGIPKYLYDAVVDGETLITGSWDPEHDLARALLERGVTGWVQMVYPDGKRGLRFDIEKFAPWVQQDHWKHGLRLRKFEKFPTGGLLPARAEPAEASE